jgi:hypothetical protein
MLQEFRVVVTATVKDLTAYGATATESAQSEIPRASVMFESVGG